MDGVVPPYFLDLRFSLRQLARGILLLEDHNIVEIELTFAINFDQSEVAVVDSLYEGVSTVKSFLSRRRSRSHLCCLMFKYSKYKHIERSSSKKNELSKQKVHKHAQSVPLQFCLTDLPAFFDYAARESSVVAY